jgi:hypothetical protein
LIEFSSKVIIICFDVHPLQHGYLSIGLFKA